MDTACLSASYLSGSLNPFDKISTTLILEVYHVYNDMGMICEKKLGTPSVVNKMLI